MLAAIMHAGFRTGHEVMCVTTVNCIHNECLEACLVYMYNVQ
jgi:hypothetical protein